MFGWLMNPFMLGLGALAVASPIVIHLLNRRRFKIVDWAAMDFLFEADKKNRRRVQVENFLLLFLRCLAMFLIGLLLARPFLPTAVVSLIQTNQKFDRIFLLDDSLSTQVVVGNAPSLDAAKDSLKRLATEFAEADATSDWLTVVLTSQPEQPLLANEPVTKETLPSILEVIDKIESTDSRADYVESLSVMRRYFGSDKNNESKVSYVLSDMRQSDWQVGGLADSELVPNKLLNQLASDSADCYLIDTGSSEDQNLAITGFRALDLQVANRIIRFAVEVANYGDASVNGARVLFQVGDAAAQYQVLPNLQPGQQREIVFPYLFENVSDFSLLASQDDAKAGFRNFKITAQIDRQSMTQSELTADQLSADSVAYTAARIFDGIPVLLVDGDPSSLSQRSETHYLNSLNVLGTGMRPETVSATELETVSLSNYKVIFLCNVDEASADRIGSLKNWVADGGSLVLMPGNKTRSTTFNDTFYEEGLGLSPISLQAIAGDPTMETWVNLQVDAQVHPALKTVVESDATSLGRVDVFSWWRSEYDKEKLGDKFIVPMRLSDGQNSVAMAEQTWGNGRVIAFAIPADGDWSMWPSSPTYAPVMLDLIDYLVGSVGESLNVRVGGAVSYPVDLSVTQSRVSLKDPQGERIEAVARPVADPVDGDETDDVFCRVEFDDIKRQGFYEIGLKQHDGESQSVVFACNVDPAEGRLQRMDPASMEGDFFADSVKRISVFDVTNEKVSTGNAEVWPQIVWLLLAVLGLEQALGWWFGKKR